MSSNKIANISLVNTTKAIEEHEHNVVMIPLELIKTHEGNRYRMEDIEGLAEDIEENGLYHNLVVMPIEDDNYKYKIISGERRYKAYQLLERNRIPCIIKKELEKTDEISEIRGRIMLHHANVKVRIPNDMELSNAAQDLLELYTLLKSKGHKFKGRTRELIASELKESPAKVQKLLTIQKLIPELKTLVEQEKISLESANKFAQMEESVQMVIYQSLLEGIEITAKKAKEIKEQIESDLRSTSDKLNKLQETLKKKDEQLGVLDTDKKKLEKSVSDLNEVIEKLETEKKLELDKAEEQAKEIKKNLEDAIRAEISNENQETINKLKKDYQDAVDKVAEIEKKHDAILKAEKKKMDSEIEALNNRLTEKDCVEKNKAIQSLALQAQKAMVALYSEITEALSDKGFILSDETKKLIESVSKVSENDL